jgi:hypothetical protein
LDFDRVTRLIFLKNQNDIILVKKTKVNGLQPGRRVNPPGRNWVAGSTRRGQPGFFFSCFFFNPTWFQLQIDHPDWVRPCFKTMDKQLVS